MFHQSGGCCDGSSPMCYPDGDFMTGDADVFLGDLDVTGSDPVPVWMSREQFAYWSHTHLTIDIVPGRGAGFSLEAPTGHRFLIRSRDPQPRWVGQVPASPATWVPSSLTCGRYVFCASAGRMPNQF